MRASACCSSIWSSVGTDSMSCFDPSDCVGRALWTLSSRSVITVALLDASLMCVFCATNACATRGFCSFRVLLLVSTSVRCCCSAPPDDCASLTTCIAGGSLVLSATTSRAGGSGGSRGKLVKLSACIDSTGAPVPGIRAHSPSTCSLSCRTW